MLKFVILPVNTAKMAQHNELGKQGEEVAARLLKSEGYAIVERNWNFHGYEIDIVAENEEFIVFVEVKTRTSVQWGNPEDFVGKSRQRRMIEGANHYLIENDINKPARFDIIGAVWNGRTFETEHIEDAFLPFL
ncbi:MAG: YraN family protein [Petrimonas sp.]|nr:YraN family protein [Petrimonas sp.]